MLLIMIKLVGLSQDKYFSLRVKKCMQVSIRCHMKRNDNFFWSERRWKLVIDYANGCEKQVINTVSYIKVDMA